MFELSQASYQLPLLPQLPLHLLLIEDVSEDVELILLALESAEINFTYDAADSLRECQALLETKSYNAVLSDYCLPNFNALKVLELLKQFQLDIPLILITGSLGEEAAVECIKAGMTDYVLKDRLYRLATVLERSLVESELRRQQKAAIARIQKQAWRESILNQIIQVMRETLILDEVFQATVNQLHEALQVSHCLIFQLHGNGEMKAKYVSQSSTNRANLLGISCDFYLIYEQQLSKGEQIVINQINNHPIVEVRQIGEKCTLVSVVITPLIYQQTYLGGISLHQCNRERTWTEDELLLVKNVADQCAIAIHQAQLYQQAQTELAERKKIELALRKSEQRFRALIENATDIIIIIDPEGIINYISPSVKQILDTEPETLINTNIWGHLHPEDIPLVEQSLKQLIQNPDITQVSIEYRMSDLHDSWHVLEAVISNLTEDPAVQGIVINCHDITERKQFEAQLKYDAFHDRLTGLPNRTLFIDRVEQALKRAKRRPNYLFAVLCLDIDRFKIINDSLGHLIGDQVLVAIAGKISKCLRAENTFACLGGDEFAILLDDISCIDDANTVAERIHQTLRQPLLLNEQEIFVSASIGIVVSSDIYEYPDQILRDADTAMYCAKTRGKARHEVFEASMHVYAVRQLYLENELRRAIERQELIVYYQPIINLIEQRLEGFEALVRWQHPEQGLISPAEFIPLAEETGLIVALDQWVLRQACQQLRIWQQQFPQLLPLTMSVNLSGKQFSQANLLGQIDEILRETGIEGKDLKLEITESILMENATSAAEMLMQIRARQIKVCMDDFGTGYSSLSYLHRFPINVLKIDRSFINKIEFNSNLAIVRSIVTMAQELNINLVAEGVETSAQVSLLNKLGCDAVQGYWFSAPVDSARMEILLQTRFNSKLI